MGTSDGKSVYAAANRIADEVFGADEFFSHVCTVAGKEELFHPVCEAIRPGYKDLDENGRWAVFGDAWFFIGLAIGQRLGRGAL